MKKITSYLDQKNVISAKISHLYLNIEELRAWKKGLIFFFLVPFIFYFGGFWIANAREIQANE